MQQSPWRNKWNAGREKKRGSAFFKSWKTEGVVFGGEIGNAWRIVMLPFFVQSGDTEIKYDIRDEGKYMNEIFENN